MKVAVTVASACALLLGGAALWPEQLSRAWESAEEAVAPDRQTADDYAPELSGAAEILALEEAGISVTKGGAQVKKVGSAAGGYHAGAWPTPSSLGGDFTLVDHKGRPVTLASFKGKPSVVFFGYARCEDICPFSAQLMAAALDAMPDRGAGINALFISFDSKHETREDLARFVAQIHPQLVGLTGTRAQVHQVSALYKVHRQMVPHTQWKTAHSPEWRHTSHFYLLSADGEVIDYVYPTISPQELAQRLVDLTAGIVPQPRTTMPGDNMVGH